MAGWRSVRVFLSSTFRDMHAERDHLVKVVFPSLRERLLPYRVELVDIDLRWGITEAQAENEQVLSLCLEQIDECQLFFGFLGGRYGWVPEHYPRDALTRFPWIAELDSESKVSVTELEMLHGVLRHPPGTGKPALFCFRDPTTTDAIPEPIRSQVFFEVDRKERLADLKRRVAERGCAAPKPYPCRWDAQAPDLPTRSRGRWVGLEEFGRQVQDWLWLVSRELLNLPEQPG